MKTNVLLEKVKRAAELIHYGICVPINEYESKVYYLIFHYIFIEDS